MIDGLAITTNAYEVALRYESRKARLRAALAKVVDRSVNLILRYIAQTKITQGGILEPRTGQLRRALYRTPVVDDGTTIAASVGADLGIAPQARIQELGGTVTAKSAAHLAIPIGDALTAKGVARFSARELISNPFNFGFSGTFTKNDIIFGRLAAGDVHAVPLFVLKSSVTLPARHYLSSSFDEKRDEIVQMAEAAVRAEAQA